MPFVPTSLDWIDLLDHSSASSCRTEASGGLQMSRAISDARAGCCSRSWEINVWLRSQMLRWYRPNIRLDSFKIKNINVDQLHLDQLCSHNIIHVSQMLAEVGLPFTQQFHSVGKIQASPQTMASDCGRPASDFCEELYSAHKWRWLARNRESSGPRGLR